MNETATGVIVAGAGGRMGQRLLTLLCGGAAGGEPAGLRLVGALGSTGSPRLGRDAGELIGAARCGVLLSDDVESVLARAAATGPAVLVEFTRADVAPILAERAAACGVAVVSGTTGLDEAGRAAQARAATRVPLLTAPNFSLGMAALRALVRQAVAWLGPGFDAEIVELHHRDKLDAPSGSALALAEEVAAGRGGAGSVRLQRAGRGPARPDDEIGVFGLRGGDVVGEHTVYLLGPGERLELTHRASDRDLFARGALRAAAWLAGRPAGRYTIEQLLEP